MADNLQRLDQNFPWDRSPLQRELRRLMGVLEPRFRTLENRVIDWEGAVEAITGVGLQRVNDTLGGLLTQLQQAADVGFMIIRAAEQPQTLVVDPEEPLGFQATSDGFQLFQPTTYLLIVDDDDQANWGMLKVQGWLKNTGELSAEVVFAAKEQAGENWTISCNAAVWQAMRDLLDDTVAAKEAVEAAQATVADQVALLQSLIDIIQGGPVASVAGKSGVVTLALADIVGLVAALAAKADADAVATLLAGKQDADAKLDAIAAMTWAADKVLMATAAGAIATLDASTLGKALLAAANADVALTSLGVSEFIKTLLNDADQAAARATLGVLAGPVSVAKSANYTVTADDIGKVIEVTTGSSTDKTITLLAASTAGDGAIVTINKIDSGSNKVIVSDGGARAWLSTQYDEVAFRSNGTIWEPHKVNISPRVDVFTANGTWTKPPLARLVHAELFGSGGGGGGGVRQNANAVYGATGGSGGARVEKLFKPSELSATEPVTVPAGGSGGAATAAFPGGTGGDGGATSFGSLSAGGGKGGAGANSSLPAGNTGGSVIPAIPAASGNATALEGAGAAAAAGANGNNAVHGGASGGVGDDNAPGGNGGSSVYGCAGGGGGGGVVNGASVYQPGAGGTRSSYAPGGGAAAGTSSLSSPTAGSNGSGVGIGGGGGGSSASANAQPGGAGGIGAGGGGGGSRFASSGSAGNGGAGGRGEATITTYF